LRLGEPREGGGKTAHKGKGQILVLSMGQIAAEKGDEEKREDVRATESCCLVPFGVLKGPTKKNGREKREPEWAETYVPSPLTVSGRDGDENLGA